MSFEEWFRNRYPGQYPTFRVAATEAWAASRAQTLAEVDQAIERGAQWCDCGAEVDKIKAAPQRPEEGSGK